MKRLQAFALASCIVVPPAFAADLLIDLAPAGKDAKLWTEGPPGGPFVIHYPVKATLQLLDGWSDVALLPKDAGGEKILQISGVKAQTEYQGTKVRFTFTKVEAAAPMSAPAAPAPAPAPAPSTAAAAASNPPAPASGPFIDAIKQTLTGDAAAATTNYKNFLVDMSIPATPAFAVLGVTPKILIEPQSPRDLATSLVMKLRDSAALANGIGFDVAPYMLMYGKTLTLDEYRKSTMLQTVARTQLSFGALKTADGPNKGTHTAVGLSVPLLDEGDPRVAPALGNCYTRAFNTLNASPTLLQAVQARAVGKEDEARQLLTTANTKLSADFDKCRDDFKKSHWNASRWSLGLGQAYDKPTGGQTNAGTRSIWTTYAMRIGKLPDEVGTPATGAQGQLLLHLRATDREPVESTTDPRGFNLRRSTTLGVGAKFGTETFNLSAEASRSNSRFDTGEHERSRKFAVGTEFQFTKDMWFVLSVGGQGGYANGKNSPFVLGSVKYGTSTESTGAFGPPAK